jgi:hypothetical protein
MYEKVMTFLGNKLNVWSFIFMWCYLCSTGWWLINQTNNYVKIANPCSNTGWWTSILKRQVKPQHANKVSISCFTIVPSWISIPIYIYIHQKPQSSKLPGTAFATRMHTNPHPNVDDRLASVMLDASLLEMAVFKISLASASARTSDPGVNYRTHAISSDHINVVVRFVWFTFATSKSTVCNIKT